MSTALLLRNTRWIVLLLPLACSDFEGYAPVDAGGGGRGGRGSGGTGGLGGSGGGDAGDVPDASVPEPDAASDAGGAPGDGGPLDGGDAGPRSREEVCQAVCALEAQLGGCQPAPTCADDLCNAAQPNGCSDEYDAYYACLADEPVSSFTCANDTPQPDVGNNGCASSECAYFTCIGFPIVCTL
jgi:hypothetical protein